MEFKRTKMGLLVVFLLSFTATAKAQTFSEWFRQKKTQKEYLAKQITGLQLYIGYARKGYETLRTGWNTVQMLRNGEFNLHGDFFGGLASISPIVRNYRVVPEFIALQLRLLDRMKTARKLFAAHVRLKPNESEYLGAVFDKTVATASKLLDELMAVALQPGLELSEGERLKLIDRLYQQLQGLDRFVRSFNRENYQQLRHRAWHAGDLETIRQLHQLKTP
ncbi:hypothetical protein DN752_04260 [Echinicola strongylocentroti]|uniref:TerB family tellurite resistance protein n=1 Tax=Echinicola strongylocentroti TaxID=1795355 RepID=A0A2Z4IF66_9BACT|nr:hypothetical protein [Echinicola strongylocentroti]AWW29419.1 hypothetical protein DN752_04260 [Echinicola strongylocentroti]